MKSVIATLSLVAFSVPAYADIFISHHKSPSMLAASGLLAAVAGGIVWIKRRSAD